MFIFTQEALHVPDIEGAALLTPGPEGAQLKVPEVESEVLTQESN